VEKPLVLQRIHSAIDDSVWQSIPLCGAHFLISESMSSGVFVSRFVVDGVVDGQRLEKGKQPGGA